MNRVMGLSDIWIRVSQSYLTTKAFKMFATLYRGAQSETSISSYFSLTFHNPYPYFSSISAVLTSFLPPGPAQAFLSRFSLERIKS